MKKAIAACLVFALLFTALLPVALSAAEQTKVSREYFEKLDKESTLQDIEKAAGEYGIEGSGILYFVWNLEDGSKAKVVFDSKGRIVMIYITGEQGSERIYRREYATAGSDAGQAEKTENTDIDQAVEELAQAIKSRFTESRWISSDLDYELFDVTGDGCPDLCTCVTWGSDIVRTDLLVYDPVKKELYVLDDPHYDYLFDHIEADRIVIAQQGPFGGDDQFTATFGTVKTEDGNLVFVPDPEEP